MSYGAFGLSLPSAVLLASPKREGVNWNSVRRTLRERQDERDFLKQGFKRVHAFSALGWESPNVGRVLEARVNRDGTALYVKTVEWPDSIATHRKQETA